MKRQNTISVAFLACLMLFAIAMPFASATTVTNEPAAPNDVGPFYYHANPIFVKVTSGSASPTTYTDGILYNTVTELRKAYDLNPLYAEGYDGAGQTVVIIDAFGSPTIYSDLLSFIKWQNTYAGADLPWTTLAEIESHVHIYYPLGYVRFNESSADEVGWSFEVTLDVDMVHAIAPGANIALVISPSDNDLTMSETVEWAVVNHLGSVISQSWGDPEWNIVLTVPHWQTYLSYSHAIYMLAAQEGITVFASAGDDGAMEDNPLLYNSPLYPASDPYVTAVGGTNLFMYTNTTYKEGEGEFGTDRWSTSVGIKYNYEVAGNDYEAMIDDGNPSPNPYWVTTGGAMSQFFPLPSWQQGIKMTYANGASFTPTMRCVSDVSWDSGVYGGLGLVPYTANKTLAGYYIVGGTSAGSPAWSALTAIADQYVGHSLGYLNPMLYANRDTFYSTGAFHDITKGDNTEPYVLADGTILYGTQTYDGWPMGYEATTGWDAPTGIGSPNAAVLVPLMKGW